MTAREVKLRYALSGERAYQLEYDPEQNALFAAYLFEHCGCRNEVRTEGQMAGVYKFTAQTVDDYIQQGLGGFIPILVEDTLIYDEQQLRTLNITEQEVQQILSHFPKLKRVRACESDNPYEMQLMSVSRSVCDVDGNIIEQQELHNNYSVETWLSSRAAPMVDVRTIIDDQDICNDLARRNMQDSTMPFREV